MKHLLIRHLGPLKEADVDLGRFNLIIGKQSSGKSCVLRTASYCAWVEKQILLAQSGEYFMKGANFRDDLVRYHKMENYFWEDTTIMYETECVKFGYDNKHKAFTYKIKSEGLKYKRPKISYIPSERNIVSLLPEWKSQVSTYDCLLDFMNDWDRARRFILRTKNILNLGMSYEYDKNLNEDRILLPNKKPLLLSNSSSGVQSLIPLYLAVDYLANGVYEEENSNSSKRTQDKREQIQRLLKDIYFKVDRHEEVKERGEYIVKMENMDFRFDNEKSKEDFLNMVDCFTMTQRSDVYLEEPEDNLFPPTQCQLIDWLLELAKRRKHVVSMFVTTHSPYVLTHLLENKVQGFRFFFTYQMQEEDGFVVRAANDEDIEEILSNGVDMFFNFESYIDNE